MREKYESLALTDLKEIAKVRGIKGTSTMKKADIIRIVFVFLLLTAFFAANFRLSIEIKSCHIFLYVFIFHTDLRERKIFINFDHCCFEWDFIFCGLYLVNQHRTACEQYINIRIHNELHLQTFFTITLF